MLAAAREARYAVATLFAGDIAPRKKLALDICLLAAERLALDPARTVVVEDTRIGLLAAKAAGMHCVVTPSPYTRGEDFTGADLVVADLEAGGVTLETLRRLTAR
jgi:beta-phosphoglucomutase-like phosphatase (HAD superfamily)